ncbi:tetratricopeptide repeat protein [Leptolyngbya iicbica]|nr:tetratricopeptide repeat protein [Leptolyngbya sp. LK]
MAIDPLDQLDLSELPDYDADAEYGALLRALRRQEGFGILFVRCSPSQGRQLIDELKQDLPQKRCAELTLREPLKDGDFFGFAAAFVAEHPADVVFVQGMEHSLLDYEETKRQSGWTKAEIQNYSWKDVPPILRNLNQQRDRFRNELPVCFVFLVPLFLVKYLKRRAPDFFDWRSGVFELQDDDATLKQQVEDCRLEDPSQIKNLSAGERIQRALEIKDLLDNPTIQSDQQFRLLYDLGLIQFENQDSRSGWVSWDKASHVPVCEAESLYLQGNVLYKLRRYEEAIASYECAVKIKPDYHETWYNCGLALHNLGRYEEAIASYERTADIEPDNHYAWYGRSLALYNLRRYEEAIASYERAVDIEPDNHYAWYGRGLALYNLRRYEEAIASYERTVDIEPDNYHSWYGRGLALYNLRRYEEAVASYERAVEIKPDYHEAWYNRGIALDDLGRYEDAIASYDKALEIRPDYELAQDNRQIALKKLRSPLRRLTSWFQGWFGNQAVS